MANSYKNIIITTNRGSSNDDPKIVFSGANTSVNTDVTLKVYPDSNGTLSFEGSAGQLFSITNDLTGSIFSVNDVSGLPIIDVNANSSTSIIGRSFQSNAAPALSITDTWANSSLNFTTIRANVARTSADASSSLMDLQVNGNTRFKVLASSGGRTHINGPNIHFYPYDEPSMAGFNSRISHSGNETISFIPYNTFIMAMSAVDFNPNVQINKDKSFGWSNTNDLSGSGDLRLWRDSGNTLAQRYGTYPQTFRLYGTYTDASNYERLAFFANSTAAYIQTENAGTGSARPLYLGANNATAITIDTAGRVGIGTSSPGAVLDLHHVQNATRTFLGFGVAGGPGNIATFSYSAADTSFGINLPNRPLIIRGGGDGTVEMVRFTSTGNVGIGTTSPTAKLDVNTDIIRIRTSKTPASATATGNQGDICWDSSYIYVCTATNTWVRANLSTW